jgi:hypothetical protein
VLQLYILQQSNEHFTAYEFRGNWQNIDAPKFWRHRLPTKYQFEVTKRHVDYNCGAVF